MALIVAEAASLFPRVELLRSDTWKGYLEKTVATKMLITNEANGTSEVYHDQSESTKAQTTATQTMTSACLMHLLEYFE